MINDRNAVPMFCHSYFKSFFLFAQTSKCIPMALAGIHLPWLTPKYSTESPMLKTGPAKSRGTVRAWTPDPREEG